MTSREKSNLVSTVKSDGEKVIKGSADHHNLTRYCVIVLILLFTIMLVNMTLCPDTPYTNSNEGTDKDNDIKGNHIHNDADVCTSADCVQAAARLSSYMDSNVNPCEDFYQYSCGGWDNTHSIPSIQGHWDIFGDFSQKNYDYFLKLLSEAPNQNDSEVMVKAKRIFIACNNTDQIDKDEVEAIKYIINITGGWDRTDIKQNKTWSINSNLPLERYHSSGAFFGFQVKSDEHDSSKAVIEISESGLTLAIPNEYKDDNTFRYLKSFIAKVLTPVITNGDLQQIADNIANFERELAFSFLPFQYFTNVTAIYHPMSLRNLTQLCPEIDWVNYFNTLFDLALGSGQHHTFTEDDIVIVRTVDYFAKLNNFLKSTNPDTLRDYAKWQLILYTVLFVDLNPTEKIYEYLPKNRFLSKFHELSETQAEICVLTVEVVMPFAVIRPFVDNFISDDLKKRVNDTFTAIEKVFIDRIMENDWLDATTKQRCIDKVNAIIRLIGYPDFIKNDTELDNYYADLQFPADADYYIIYFEIQRYSLVQSLRQYGKPENRSQWRGVTTDPNVFYYQDMLVYNQVYNHMGVAATTMQSPFVMADWPPSLLFGTLGMILGRVITHGFNRQGQQYDKNGDFTQWWTNASIAAYNGHAKCFEDQYNSYKLQGVPMNGTVALDENIADSAGVHIAFQAYRNAANLNESLPNINLPNDQVFFVSFGQV